MKDRTKGQGESTIMLTTRPERQLASGTWLLAAAPLRAQAVSEWEDSGAAWLRPGALFTAVIMPASLVHAAVGLPGPRECAPHLAEVLEEGPMFFHRGGFGSDDSYTALLPASASHYWHMSRTVVHTSRALLLVPAPDVCGPADDGRPWWVSPLEGPGLLCPADKLAALVGLGLSRTTRARAALDA